MLFRLESLFYSCPDHGGETDLAPLSPFMEHVRCRTEEFRENPPESPADRANFAYWFVESFRPRRAPFDVPVPAELLEWLNEPALDLTTVFSEEPVPGGLRKRSCRRYLTRLMLHMWQSRQSEWDIFTPAGYYGFLVWFATEAAVRYALPKTVIPDELVELLNYPAVGYGQPLTVGMFALSTTISPERFESGQQWTREDVLAASYEGLSCLIKGGDVRLLPEYVTRFWSARPFPDVPIDSSFESFLTAFEYTTAHVKPESGVSDGFRGYAFEQQIIRRWFLDVTKDAAPGNLLFSGFVMEDRAGFSAPPFQQKQAAVSAIAMYRDRQIIAGLSRAAEATVQALIRAGHDVVEFDYALARTRMAVEAAANESVLRSAGRMAHIFGFNPEYVPECIACNFARMQEDDYLIGQFYWELSSISKVHEFGLELMDEIWVASEYLRNLYARFTDKPVLNMKQAVVLPRALRHDTRSHFGLQSEAFTFLLSFDGGSSIIRKNPLGAVEAFQKSFPPAVRDVALVIKTRNSQHFPTGMDRAQWEKVWRAAGSDLRIQILDTTLSNDELVSLNNVCDVFVSLHRSEGFGFGPAEAMALGKPVIVTNYSSVTDFCNSETAMLVDCREVDAPAKAYPYMDSDRTYRWAEPDVDSAAAAFRALYEDRDLGQRLGAAARRLIETEYSVDALSRRMNRRLKELGFLPDAERHTGHAMAGGPLR